MVTYDFYVNTYMGDEIPENRFLRCAARASAELDYLSGVCRVVGGDTARAMAICSMAEAVYQHSRMGSVHSSRVGDVSVQYNRLENLNRDLYDRACIYLDIYRGL